MPTIAANGKHLLDAVKQMAPEEFDAFIDEALSVRTQAKSAILSAAETKLIKRINRGLPSRLSKRYAQLSALRDKRSAQVSLKLAWASCWSVAEREK